MTEPNRIDTEEFWKARHILMTNQPKRMDIQEFQEEGFLLEVNIKRMDIQEFQEGGYLLEVNRRFFHPLGLALEIVREEDGSMHLGGIWDYRDDPEGLLFPELDEEDIAKARHVQQLRDEKAMIRRERYGFVVQPIELGESVCDYCWQHGQCPTCEFWLHTDSRNPRGRCRAKR